MDIPKALTRIRGNVNTPVFVLLHGWGSNEYDLPDLLRFCAPDADYASLRAPIEYGMGYTWFGTWDHEGVPSGASLDEQALAAAEAVDRWVAANVDESRRVVVMGFSQGGLLAGHMLRVNPERYMAAVCFSGWLAPGAVPGDERLKALTPPVFYGHGGADTIFTPDELAAMSGFWKTHGTLTEKIYPGMEHSINMPEMRDVSMFLQSIGAARPTF
ncbi:alpha/beta hydrolase [Bifidobacterium callimiconis]|uniref:Phospholipase n=1 Tax=Bifidobacterium callimiconis TaxID=2306973 RepID=A0A430FFQ7_9BIFI|nr:alpha/beta fold hydrolase [Bifidobacterium callimiconis]RSX51568.1 phospholipase [Bifidobacterium callimiconis]